MKKICFVLVGNSGLSYTYLGALNSQKNLDELRDFLSNKYEVSFNFSEDGDKVDYLAIPENFAPVENPKGIPEIKIPNMYLFEKDFSKIEKTITSFIEE